MTIDCYYGGSILLTATTITPPPTSLVDPWWGIFGVNSWGWVTLMADGGFRFFLIKTEKNLVFILKQQHNRGCFFFEPKENRPKRNDNSKMTGFPGESKVFLGLRPTKTWGKNTRGKLTFMECFGLVVAPFGKKPYGGKTC